MMWIKERCKIVSFPINSITYSFKAFNEYVRNIFSLAHTTNVYILLEPTPMPIKINSIKRYIVFPLLSAVICDNTTLRLFDKVHEIVDGAWAKVGIVLPFVNTALCGSAKAFNLYLDINPIKGTPYLCSDRAFIDYEIGEKILSGGFIEIISNRKELGHKLVAENSWEPLQTFIHNIINFVQSNQSNTVLFSPTTISKSLYPYVKTLVSVDGKPAVMRLGKGIIFSIDTATEIASILYHILVLITHIMPIEA
ncbi:MAG: hypothetical protein QXH10_01795 [Ignisphaera sp.]|uniref:Uncharacterized protein n=1 Tax=Ignisphaera aggregans TaxID=334771 RepID=A0A832CX79_9CREN